MKRYVVYIGLCAFFMGLTFLGLGDRFEKQFRSIEVEAVKNVQVTRKFYRKTVGHVKFKERIGPWIGHKMATPLPKGVKEGDTIRVRILESPRWVFTKTQFIIVPEGVDPYKKGYFVCFFLSAVCFVLSLFLRKSVEPSVKFSKLYFGGWGIITVSWACLLLRLFEVIIVSDIIILLLSGFAFIFYIITLLEAERKQTTFFNEFFDFRAPLFHLWALGQYYVSIILHLFLTYFIVFYPV